ncbi:MAG: hypothetical protein AB9866_04780 [Syntrophobacteraceae bacterium]
MQKINNKTFVLILYIFTSFVVAYGCDRGVWYRPMNWRELNNLQWVNSFGPAEIQISTLGNFYGMESSVIEMHVTNHTDDLPISLQNVALITKSGRYVARIDSHPIIPNDKGKFALYWDFKEPVLKVLVEPVALQITLHIGAKETEFLIPMTRK